MEVFQTYKMSIVAINAEQQSTWNKIFESPIFYIVVIALANIGQILAYQAGAYNTQLYTAYILQFILLLAVLLLAPLLGPTVTRILWFVLAAVIVWWLVLLFPITAVGGLLVLPYLIWVLYQAVYGFGWY